MSSLIIAIIVGILVTVFIEKAMTIYFDKSFNDNFPRTRKNQIKKAIQYLIKKSSIPDGYKVAWYWNLATIRITNQSHKKEKELQQLIEKRRWCEATKFQDSWKGIDDIKYYYFLKNRCGDIYLLTVTSLSELWADDKIKSEKIDAAHILTIEQLAQKRWKKI